MTSLFVALTADDTPRMYGYESGAGHALLIPAGAMNDPLATGGTIGTACGGKGVDSERLTEKFTGDRMCARCVKWLATTGGKNDIEAAREAKYAQYAEGAEGGPELGADIAPAVREIAREEVREIVKASKGAQGKARRTVAVDRERARLTEQRAARDAQNDRCDGTGEPPMAGTRVQRDDHTVSVPDDYNGKHSGKCPGEGCDRIIAVSREGGMRRHKRPTVPAVRDESAPTLPGMDETTGVTGLTHAEMRAQVAAYYAAGHPVPAEVASLPDPAVRRGQWSGTNGAGDTDYRGCAGKGPVEIVNPERTHGKCPECRAYIPLADTVADDDFRIGSHFEYGVNPPANPHMSSKSMDTVEHGTIPGDPAAADKRRVAETRCGRSRKVVKDATGGTITCDGPKGCGRRGVELKRVQRKKGDVWIMSIHTVPGESFRRAGADGKGERKVTPRGTGADAGKGQRDHGSVDGAATTGSQNMAPVRPGGWVGKAGTMSLPATVRPGVDPGVSGEICPLCQAPKDIAHKGMSRAQRRRHSTKVGAYLKGREEAREASKAREIAEGSRLTGTERRESRKVASVGSFADGNVGGTVSHEPRPEFTPKGERKPAPRKADKRTQEAARKGLARAGK
jgi:hypothetical protein